MPPAESGRRSQKQAPEIIRRATRTPRAPLHVHDRPPSVQPRTPRAGNAGGLRARPRRPRRFNDATAAGGRADCQGTSARRRDYRRRASRQLAGRDRPHGGPRHGLPPAAIPLPRHDDHRAQHHPAHVWRRLPRGHPGPDASLRHARHGRLPAAGLHRDAAPLGQDRAGGDLRRVLSLFPAVGLGQHLLDDVQHLQGDGRQGRHLHPAPRRADGPQGRVRRLQQRR